ncbi:hypothetical protein GCM10020256_00330 [Streptomyces thermocoprophilus]
MTEGNDVDVTEPGNEIALSEFLDRPRGKPEGTGFPDRLGEPVYDQDGNSMETQLAREHESGGSCSHYEHVRVKGIHLPSPDWCLTSIAGPRENGKDNAVQASRNPLQNSVGNVRSSAGTWSRGRAGAMLGR